MLFNSIVFIVFFITTTIVYYLIPKNARYIWLLIISYFFYMNWKAEYGLLLFATTIITFGCGLGVSRSKKQTTKKLILGLCVIVNLGTLFYFKYFDYLISILNRIVLGDEKFDALNIILPVGISFFTFQAIGYTIDVYRGKIEVEKNILRYALFVSFYPQLVAGPIERSYNLLKQLKEPKRLNFYDFRVGLLYIIWGYFQKIVIADRAAIFVDTVYSDINTYGGWYLIIATMLFAVQILCDFGGYSSIAIGTAKILGINLMRNFDAPYISTSINHFWRRWHISLTSWFTDYLYIPLGGNRKGRIRKYINEMIVFLTSGLWHGSNITFVIWGG